MQVLTRNPLLVNPRDDIMKKNLTAGYKLWAWILNLVCGYLDAYQLVQSSWNCIVVVYETGNRKNVLVK